MAVEQKTETSPSMPVIGMVMMGLIGAVVSSLCFIVIRYWPVPASVAPYFGGRVGMAWGLVVGGILGLILGYLVDDTHFDS